MDADDIKRVLEARKAPNYLQAEDRPADKLPEYRRQWLVRYFEENPGARVALVSASPGHSIAGAIGRAPRFDDPGVREAIYEQSLYGAAFSAAMADGMAKVDRGLTPLEYLREAKQTLADAGVHRPETCRCYGLKGCGESPEKWKARVKREVTVPVERQAPGTAPWPPEFIYDDIVPSAPAPTLRDLQLGAAPDLSPCTLPPRPPVVITRVR